MGKGFSTRQHIVSASAAAMNVQGYLATPVSEIMRVTGLTKGGLYNHFGGRDEIAAAAYEYASDLSLAFMQDVENGPGSGAERLLGLFDAYRDYGSRFPLKGGCPLLRGAVEGANGPDWLQQRARRGLRQMIGIFERLIAQGRSDGSIVPDSDPLALANAIVATLEGSVMLAGLFKDAAPSRHALDLLETYVRRQLLI